MALFHNYKCTKCRFKIQTEPRGYYALMSGMCFTYKCSNCRKIITLSMEEMQEEKYNLYCPECGDKESLSSWNPIEGKCPKCGSNMKEIGFPLLHVD